MRFRAPRLRVLPLLGAAGAERRIDELGISLPPPPTPFGSYVEAVRTGGLLFLSGMLPTAGHESAFVGRLGKELDAEAGRHAARIATLNALAAAKQHLTSLDHVLRIIRLGVYISTAGDFGAHAHVADGASELLESIFGPKKTSSRLVIGVASLPFGMPVELEFIFEIAGSLS